MIVMKSSYIPACQVVPDVNWSRSSNITFFSFPLFLDWWSIDDKWYAIEVPITPPPTIQISASFGRFKDFVSDVEEKAADIGIVIVLLRHSSYKHPDGLYILEIFRFLEAGFVNDLHLNILGIWVTISISFL